MTSRLNCPRCGAADVQMTSARRYCCAQCGAALELYPLPNTSGLRCPHCQAIVMNDAPFCHRCGAVVQVLSPVLPCPTCGQLMPAASSFCPYCCAQVVTPEDESPVESITYRESTGCPACGKDIGPTTQVCPYCGVVIEGFLASLRRQALSNLPVFDKKYGFDAELMDNPSPKPRPRPSQPPATNRTFFVAALILALLMLAGVVLLLVLVRSAGGM